ncbi:hypothetical protein SAMN04489765_4421 [Tsukamurella pulmonis]|uniref:DUF6802 domain-containing protein n=2 Tax=Tsukamurella pulmonis TaxID=47312 RepID=A0A1H1HNW3_9ACTN|nr:hypothetical protein SAMN04489765_4421 [Tsukamurella pulmonis]SUP13793.1 Uncharacterised protein [Tsukamurella pulmonis]
MSMDPEFGLFGAPDAEVFGSELFDGAVPSAAPSPGGLWVHAEAGWFDVHALDTDGDGLADTGTLSDEHGTAVFTDLDADGVADVYHRVRSDNTFETWRFVDGRWRLLDRGDIA